MDSPNFVMLHFIRSQLNFLYQQFIKFSKYYITTLGNLLWKKKTVSRS